MKAIRLQKKIDSSTLFLPELEEMVGKTVEIIVLEEPAGVLVDQEKNPYREFFALAGQDVVDPDAYKQLRAASLI